MQVAALIRCYHANWYLAQVLEQFKHLDKVLVINSRFIGTKPLPDDTLSVFNKISQQNASIEVTEPMYEHEVLNHGLDRLKDYDQIYICDADELYTEEDLAKILKLGLKHEIVTAKAWDYADAHHIYPIRTHRPIVMVKPHVRFYETRCAHGGMVESKAIMHHFGYINTAWKDNNYWDAKGDQIKDIKSGRKQDIRPV